MILISLSSPIYILLKINFQSTNKLKKILNNQIIMPLKKILVHVNVTYSKFSCGAQGFTHKTMPVSKKKFNLKST